MEVGPRRRHGRGRHRSVHDVVFKLRCVSVLNKFQSPSVRVQSDNYRIKTPMNASQPLTFSELNVASASSASYTEFFIQENRERIPHRRKQVPMGIQKVTKAVLSKTLTEADF
eukprot:TRINITY_DN22602_c0_g1_i1.p1 TRINITY_DN22602_c0_g1~~TRINITY_DN22602_c0_g1_i1.p1  ORF type:complete len:113 (-),score=11.11 TRINITY_DN22602_c0_g1_i1:537-875(-)